MSCKAKKVYITSVQKDTIIEIKEIIRTIPLTSYIEIDKPCDSLGNLRNGLLNIDSGKAKIRIIMRDNVIRVEANIDSITNSAIEKYKSTNVVEKEVIEKRYIPSWTKWSLLANLLIVVYIGIKIKGFFV